MSKVGFLRTLELNAMQSGLMESRQIIGFTSRNAGIEGRSCSKETVNNMEDSNSSTLNSAVNS